MRRQKLIKKIASNTVLVLKGMKSPFKPLECERRSVSQKPRREAFLKRTALKTLNKKKYICA